MKKCIECNNLVVPGDFESWYKCGLTGEIIFCFSILGEERNNLKNFDCDVHLKKMSEQLFHAEQNIHTLRCKILDLKQHIEENK